MISSSPPNLVAILGTTSIWTFELEVDDVDASQIPSLVVGEWIEPDRELGLGFRPYLAGNVEDKDARDVDPRDVHRFLTILDQFIDADFSIVVVIVKIEIDLSFDTASHLGTEQHQSKKA